MKQKLLKEFEKEFVFSGDFGEKRLSIFRVNNWSEKDPIINDEDIVIDLEKFLQKAISETEKETRFAVIKELEEKLPKKKNEISELIQDSEGTFEPKQCDIEFENGFNQCLEKVQSIIKELKVIKT